MFDVKNKTEIYIIKGLLTFSDYAAKFIDKLNPSYFIPEISPVIKGIKSYYLKYNKVPPTAVLFDKALPQIFKNDENKIQIAEDIIQSAMSIEIDKEDFFDWLVDETKSFIRNKAMENGFMNAVNRWEETKDIDVAVKIINDAASINFDDDLGLDYWEDMRSRIERLKNGVNVISTGISELDAKIGGGWNNKSLNIIAAGTNVGKTLILGDLSLKLLKQGYNGLYITLEINSDLFANRIDSNLTNIKLDSINNNPDGLIEILDREKKRADEKGYPFGRFIIKEYAPNCMNSNQLMAYVRELQVKKQFKPDFIVVDYIGLVAANGKTFSENTYGKLKTVAEELRSVACRLNLPMFTAVQLNKGGYENTNPGMANVADSLGIPMTADLLIICSRDEALDSENVMRWFIAKSRFSKNNEGLLLKVDYSHQRIGDEEINLKVNHKTVKRIKNAKIPDLLTPKGIDNDPGTSSDKTIKL